MIEAYFAQIERILRDFPDVRSYTLRKKIYNIKQGFIGGSITLENAHRLDFIEVRDIEVEGKIKYRYQYMDETQALIFRYDNAPHHRHIRTFPHHKHMLNEVQASTEPTLYDVLLEIAQLERLSK
ncbi:MAG: hypothetical protein J7M27_07455 [Candidatus Latescibacteria bacterium]|nr:hypothetical protein [Candidatus Latescibacterota bacterium]RLA87097.1 MAG: hypothetical protein DRG58_11160 [Deltaproteobacteria bacterium]